MNRDRQFGIYIELGKDWTYPNIRTIAQEAEALGYDALWYQDNLTGHWPIPRELEKFDVWTLLPALAADTTSIRLGPLVTPALRREAPLLAYAASSLDIISNGRLNLGLGSGDDRLQYEMIGQRFPGTGNERREYLVEAIQVLKALWSEDRANFEGRHFRLKDAILCPKPIQRPHPPIYIGCSNSRRMMPKLAAEHGDALAIMWGHEPSVDITMDAFREEWLAFGRDPQALKALRTAIVIFSDDEDAAKARQFTEELTGFPRRYNVSASTAIIPEGAEESLFILGRPSTIAAELKRRVFDKGFNELMCSFVVYDDINVKKSDLPGHPGNYLAGMRLFVEEVMPHLRG
jgi:alkanesulfonate monooxygenase SsuD/methylene tetrahydromethanopterin reductase-like flavin-dependent oxidoreductase (luciferase family)